MKLSRGTLTVLSILLTLIVIYLFRNRSRLLPPGSLTTSTQLELPTPGPTTPITGRPRVEISTSKGNFTVELRPDLAPKTVTNFLSKWNSGYCDNLTFHRVEDWVVQGCDPAGDGTGGSTTLPTETSAENFAAGSLGVARKTVPADLSNDSQFFIVKKDSSFLNGQYTYFGRVISGMDIINRLTAGDKIIAAAFLGK
ncbi:MAG: Peptidyl-prolyl cis-trans isomerase cyclophilin type [Candidatus Amesbacteria bacterium GW2011_GWA2_47_11]|uniref:Peptidyl-prolyl cis-trans isomerase n=2 Tax=Candidatus Amesiibacteriota TaxID=1752730 RepID=A0A0G1RG08_9BACT|nr:MAG: Peptidyl-prolyl cis-trans isomerase cyclophilin type [Candidatus Amesbacteria bacterium GW2011_GWA2_47_11]KKW00399.1 MAG: Peptidyl-prolyl cis-trans isomerase cyclophilin type [Candidatus Amesbacteria bacterium GW2011_GWA1_48_9]